MKYYHMIIARPGPENFDDHSTRCEYISSRQGSAPEGWICVGVCGYHEDDKYKRTKRRFDREVRP